MTRMRFPTGYEARARELGSKASFHGVHLEPVARVRALHGDLIGRVARYWNIEVGASLQEQIAGTIWDVFDEPLFELGYLIGQADALGLPFDELLEGFPDDPSFDERDDDDEDDEDLVIAVINNRFPPGPGAPGARVAAFLGEGGGVGGADRSNEGRARNGDVEEKERNIQ